MRDPEKILLGTSIHVLEMDDEEQINNIEEAISNYQILDILYHIGKSNFREIYLNEINDIKLLPIQEQQLFCLAILDKIQQIYDFEFSPTIDFNEKLNIENVYLFLEFLEYDHVNFLVNIWRFLQPDLRHLNIDQFCQKNKNKIIGEVEDQLETYEETRFSSQFLRTYNKNDLVEWITIKTKKTRMLIYLGIRESEVNNVRRNN